MTKTCSYTDKVREKEKYSVDEFFWKEKKSEKIQQHVFLCSCVFSMQLCLLVGLQTIASPSEN